METVVGIDPRTGQGMAIDIVDGIIAAVRPDEVAGPVYLSSGLIDLQINGFRGLDLHAGDLQPAVLLSLCEELLSVGVTTWLPTLITASETSIVQALEAIARGRAEHPLIGEMVPGVHVEG